MSDTPRTDMAFHGDYECNVKPEIGNWKEAEEYCQHLEREVAKWKSDSRLLHGALLLLREAGITPSSAQLIAAADRAAGGGE